MLEEVGQPYEVRPIRFGAEMTAADYLAVNPMGKVPALLHGGPVVTEVAAICAYLADSSPEAGLAPPPSERAEFYRWMFFAAGPMGSAVTDAALDFAVAPERRGMVGYGSLASVLDAVEGMLLARPFVVRDRFTAADVVLGAQLGFGLMIEAIKPRPVFTDYLDELLHRPAAVRARAADDALLSDFPALGG